MRRTLPDLPVVAASRANADVQAMAITRADGDILVASADALVNPVNTEGVMGKGLALQFERTFPECFAAYRRACQSGDLVTGRVHVVHRTAPPRIIINFPTKRRWRDPSKLEYVRDGLLDLVTRVRELRIRSIAIPMLGCGHGGLDWMDVRPLIVAAFAETPEVEVLLFEPAGASSGGARANLSRS